MPNCPLVMSNITGQCSTRSGVFARCVSPYFQRWSDHSEETKMEDLTPSGSRSWSSCASSSGQERHQTTNRNDYNTRSEDRHQPKKQRELVILSFEIPVGFDDLDDLLDADDRIEAE